MHFTRLILFSTLLSFGCALPAQADEVLTSPADVWSANLETTHGQVQLLTTFEKAHPKSLSRRRDLSTNPLRVLREARQVLSLLSPADREDALRIGPGERVSLRGFADGIERYDQKLVDSVKQEMLLAVDILAMLPIDAFHDLQTDFLSLALHSDIRAAGMDRFLTLVPWLYMGDGTLAPHFQKSQKSTVLNRLREILQHTTGDEIDEHFRHRYRYYLDPLLRNFAERTHNENVTMRHLKRFLEKFVFGFLDANLKSQDPYTVSLEEVPKTIALLRGVFGWDCADQSVSAYVLAPEARVFAIRRSFGASADVVGYLFVLEIMTPNGVVPYIVTINGQTMDWQEARLSALAVAKMYSSWRVFVPTTETVVNTEDIRVGLWKEKRSSSSLKLEEPSFWSAISKVIRPDLEDFYKWKNLESVHSIFINDLNERMVANRIILSRGPVRYTRASANDIPLVSRAMIAASFRHLTSSTSYEADEFLGVSEAAIQSATQLYKSTPMQPLTANELREVATGLGTVPYSALTMMLPDLRAATIGELYKQDPKFFEPSIWKRLIDDIVIKMRTDPRVSPRSEVDASLFEKHLATRLKLPLRYLAESPWSQINFYLAKFNNLSRKKATLLALAQADEWPEFEPLEDQTIYDLIAQEVVDSERAQSDVFFAALAALLTRRSLPADFKFDIARYLPAHVLHLQQWIKFIHLIPLGAHWSPYIRNALPMIFQNARGKDLRIVLHALRNQKSLPSEFYDASSMLLEIKDTETIELLRQVLRRHPNWPPRLWENIARHLQYADLPIAINMLNLLREQSTWPPEIWRALRGLLSRELNPEVESAIALSLAYVEQWPEPTLTNAPDWVPQKLLSEARSQRRDIFVSGWSHIDPAQVLSIPQQTQLPFMHELPQANSCEALFAIR